MMQVREYEYSEVPLSDILERYSKMVMALDWELVAVDSGRDRVVYRRVRHETEATAEVTTFTGVTE